MKQEVIWLLTGHRRQKSLESLHIQMSDCLLVHIVVLSKITVDGTKFGHLNNTCLNKSSEI